MDKSKRGGVHHDQQFAYKIQKLFRAHRHLYLWQCQTDIRRFGCR